MSPNERLDEVHGQVQAVRVSKRATFLDVGLPGEAPTQIVMTDVPLETALPHLGDIVRAQGELGETDLSRRRGLGQISLFAHQVPEIVAESQRPRWPGADTSERHHSQSEYIRILRLRHDMQSSLRELLNNKGYLHVDTSILQERPSGAAARTFSAMTNFDGRERHLRIAPEVDLKLVMALSGIERVYEIGRNFRNEGTGPSHHPEFTNLETYTAYQDGDEAIALTESMLSKVSEATGSDVSFDGLPQKSLDELFAEQNIDFAKLLSFFENDDTEGLRAYATLLGLDDDAASKGKSGIMDSLVKKYVRPEITSPTVVTVYLVDQMPLAATLRTDPRLADAFQVIINGAEVAKAYQEEVDPAALKHKLARQSGESADDAFANDERLIKACEMGLPPMYGIGIGLDRTTSILTGKPIKDIIPVPLTQDL